jgi:hypothetical protein
MSKSGRVEIPLWASAFVIAALVMLEAGRSPERAAHADQAVTGSAGFNMVTAKAGVDAEGQVQEVLYVIDGRDEVLYVYEIPSSTDRRIVFRAGVHLPTLFNAGRGG